jgi:uncharacterized damage-inducible protein DinB
MPTIAPQFKQYIEKTLTLLGGRDPQEVQKTAVAKLRRAIKGLTPKELGWTPAPGKWSIRQIIAHLADTEMVYGYRIRKILADPGKPIEAYDQDTWARSNRYSRHSVKQDLESLEAMRRMNLEFYKRLAPDEWEIFGVHAERGKESLRHVMRMIAGHDINHLGQIESIRRALKAESGKRKAVR